MDEKACEYGRNEEIFTSIDLDSPNSEYEIPFHGTNIHDKETVYSLDIWKLRAWAELDDNLNNDGRHLLTCDPIHEEAPFPINNQLNSKICLW